MARTPPRAKRQHYVAKSYLELFGVRAGSEYRLPVYDLKGARRFARREIESLPALLFKHLAARGHQPDDRLVVGLRSDREETVAIHNAVIKDITATAPRLASMSMRLYSPPQGREFCTSDNPVLRYNPVDAGPRGNLGLFSPGIQIIVPLSSDLLLSIVDPAYGGEGNAVERFTPDNLLFYNGLLAGFAHRYLFSRSGDFDVRSGMYQSGPRLVIA